jgi:hypothetical protein
MKSVKTSFVPELNAQVAFIEPAHGSVRVTVYIDKWEHENDLKELFLYNFDADVNAIEFAFGTRVEDVNDKKCISYTTDAAIHRPPFRIEISHQLETARMDKYEFTIEYEEV